MTRSMLDTPQRYPRAGSQSYPSPAAEADADGVDDGLLRAGRSRTASSGATGSRPCPDKGWFLILRLYSPLEPFFDQEAGGSSEIELVE